MSIGNDFAELAQHGGFNAGLGGLVGLLIGDAVGVGYEFRAPERLPSRDQIEMATPAEFSRSHAGVPVGTWSDDGAQALCLLASLLERGNFSLIDFADRLVQWLDHGYMAIDVGVQTGEALSNLRDGVSPRESGGASELDDGNGSLMRVLPWLCGIPDQMRRWSRMLTCNRYRPMPIPGRWSPVHFIVLWREAI